MISDNISRRAAIDALCKRCDLVHDDDVPCTEECNDIKILRKLPSTDRYGEWIEDKTGNGFWICSSCGFVSEASGAWLLYKYCPNCGANMRKEEDDYDYERAIDNLEYNTIYEPAFNLEDGSM